MFVDFFFELRRTGVHVSTHEWMTLMEAMSRGLHESSLDGFYHLARCVCVKDVSDFDAFDQAFLSYFKDVYVKAAAVTDDLLDWLSDPKKFAGISEEERRMIQELDLEALKKMFEERLKEQDERHDGGSKWIGTGGKSPSGHGGYHPSGVRVGGPGGGKSAMQVAQERRFRDYRKDRVLDVRQIDMALRGLRRLGREGAQEELNIESTIDATSKNAGDLELVFTPPKRNRMKLILLMDVGGSMDPYAELMERLFTAASRSGRFASFKSYYFHNCVYEQVYEDAAFR
ncbi:MAG: VWA domain-containing protein, partial [Kofleriaceae bacterium]|nr:VWA domain-containing protein [Kofleriaceae bacterium]